MASISITNVSVNYTGDTFQGKVDFDLTCTPTEARLNVGFKINLATQLNFDAIDYGSNELIEWCQKRLSTYDQFDLFRLSDNIAFSLKKDYQNYDLSVDALAYLQISKRFVFDELLKKVTPINFYKAIVRVWGFTFQEKEQLLSLIVAYPEQQTLSSHSVEFSVSKESLLNSRLEKIESEMRDRFLAMAGHQLDVWLSAELDWGNANTEGRFDYNLA